MSKTPYLYSQKHPHPASESPNHCYHAVINNKRTKSLCYWKALFALNELRLASLCKPNFKRNADSDACQISLTILLWYLTSIKCWWNKRKVLYTSVWYSRSQKCSSTHSNLKSGTNEKLVKNKMKNRNEMKNSLGFQCNSTKNYLLPFIYLLFTAIYLFTV